MVANLLALMCDAEVKDTKESVCSPREDMLAEMVG